MIIFDTETTGLVQPEAMPLSKQPQIIEFAAIKIDDITLEEKGRLEFLCNPGKPLTPEIVKITKITDAMLKGKKGFDCHAQQLIEFMFGERTIIAHNVAFDMSMLRLEARRLDLLSKTPWPPNQVCTVEASMPLKGFRLNLTKLHLHCMGKDFPQAHRAMADVEALVNCTRWLIKNSYITLP